MPLATICHRSDVLRIGEREGWRLLSFSMRLVASVLGAAAAERASYALLSPGGRVLGGHEMPSHQMSGMSLLWWAA